MSRRRRAVFVWQPNHTDLPRQQRHALAYAERTGLRIVTFAVGLDEQELLALVRGRFVEVILVDLATSASDRLADEVERAGGQVHACYRRESLTRPRMTGAVRAAHDRGASVEAIASVLGLSIREVEAALADGGQRTERTQILPRPEGRVIEPRPHQRAHLVDRAQLVERRPVRAS